MSRWRDVAAVKSDPAIGTAAVDNSKGRARRAFYLRALLRLAEGVVGFSKALRLRITRFFLTPSACGNPAAHSRAGDQQAGVLDHPQLEDTRETRQSPRTPASINNVVAGAYTRDSHKVYYGIFIGDVSLHVPSSKISYLVANSQPQFELFTWELTPCLRHIRIGTAKPYGLGPVCRRWCHAASPFQTNPIP